LLKVVRAGRRILSLRGQHRLDDRRDRDKSKGDSGASCDRQTVQVREHSRRQPEVRRRRAELLKQQTVIDALRALRAATAHEQSEQT
jgi:hypothetical protein